MLPRWRRLQEVTDEEVLGQQLAAAMALQQALMLPAFNGALPGGIPAVFAQAYAARVAGRRP